MTISGVPYATRASGAVTSVEMKVHICGIGMAEGPELGRAQATALRRMLISAWALEASVTPSPRDT